MLYLIVGAAILWLLVGLGRGQVVFKRREWRLASGGFAIAAFAGAAYVGLRGGWEISIVLVVLGLWLVTTARLNAPRAPPPPRPRRAEMTPAEARSILGVGPDAEPQEIQAAYKRLMRAVHPDQGGTSGLAAQLNQARDVLLDD
ncbi:MAG: DnaJ domain-containing protein [Proteobacteria bacterium]|nr:DnaJ domain-containing protein [Pseudomonadota bacterium]